MSSIRSGMRPMSAKAPSNTRQLIAKTFNDKSKTNSVDKVAQIWTAFGKYIAKTLKAGKGVGIPKFGNFTFTPMKVDLAGTTNPNQRDKQIREPIFQVSKDFVLGMPITWGVVHDNGALRPFEIKGTSGLVPKVRINYTEIGYYANTTKEDAKHGCDIVIRDLSDKVKSGQATQLLIPNVGNFIWKGKVAGIKFINELVNETIGKTAKAHFVNKLFANSVNRANLDLLDQKVSEGIRIFPNKLISGSKRGPVLAKNDQTITVTHDAEVWLKKNLGVTLDNDRPSKPGSTKGMRRTFSARPGFRTTQSEHHSSAHEHEFRQVFPTNAGNDEISVGRDFKIKSSSKKRRPMSAYSGMSNRSIRSDRSTKSSASIVPKMSRVTALDYCSRIATKAVLDQVQNSKFSARDLLSPTELQTILINSGIKIDIANMRGLLNHMDFPPHGKSCSILDLIRKCKEWTNASSTLKSNNFMGTRPLETVSELINIIKDCFFKTGMNIQEIFNNGADKNNSIDEEAFAFLCKKYWYPTVSEEKSRYVFKEVKRNIGINLGITDFWNIFGSVAPRQNYHIEGLRQIRDWMYKNGLTSSQAFDEIIGKREKIQIQDFDLEMKKRFTMSSPEIEAIFVAIDANADGFIDRDEWWDKVYEDANNPLQLFREIVNKNQLSSDDLLFRMNLRIWDDPLDFNQFAKALRILDPSLTNDQLIAMAKPMKNSQNKVEVPMLIKNLVGNDYETVDFRDKLYKRICHDIFETSNASRKERLKKLLVKYDELSDGTIVPLDLIKVLTQVCTSITQKDIERFVRFLEKDVRGRIDYTQFTSKIEEVQNFNPFKNLVARIKAFMKQNSQTVEKFMRRLVVGEAQGITSDIDDAKSNAEKKVTIEYFVKFLKSKVDKKRDCDELAKYVELMDIDADGYISEYDLHACVGNLNNEMFYKDNGATLQGTFKTILSERDKFFPKDALPREEAIRVVEKIKETLIAKGISFRDLFSKLDANGDEFLTFPEFSENIDPIIKLSPYIKEQLFALMDVNKIGMVDYQALLDTLKMSSVGAPRVRVEDNFNVEYEILGKIRDWIINENITVEEAFKAFDRDFDGYIGLNDLKWILSDKTTSSALSINNVPHDSVINRLYKLFVVDLNTIVSNPQTNGGSNQGITKSDLRRLVENDNPYISTGKLSNKKFMIGSDTFDWKNNVIKQIGIALSKNKDFNSIDDSYKAASNNLGKVKYRDFKKFMEETHALQGYNLTDQLVQQLFSELDPHKKGFLTESDWKQAFNGFNWYEQLIVDVEYLISTTFADVDSAYEFFCVQSKSKSFTKIPFIKALNSLLGKKLNESESSHLWMYFSRNEGKIDYETFYTVFGGLNYYGVTSLRKVNASMKTTKLVTQTSSTTQWSKNIMEKFRKIIKTSNMKLRNVFEMFDEDWNGFITPIEFRNAVRKLNLNLTAKEIDEIIKVVDRNMDGMIDWQEFAAKFKIKEYEKMIEERAKNKLAKLKEQLTLHMKSPQEAFEIFDSEKSGKLTFTNFNDLVIELSKLSKSHVPPFSIIKDLFDEIDIRKDGEIDEHEWNQTFVAVQAGDKTYSLRKIDPEIAEFEISRNAKIIREAIKRNRKFLIEKFNEISHDGNFVTFEDAKEVIRSVQRGVEIEDDQYNIIFKNALREGDMVEYKKLGKSR